MLQKVVSGFFTLLVVGAIAGCSSEPIEHSSPPLTEVKKKEVSFGGYMQNCQEHGDFGLYSYLLMAYSGNSQNFIETIRTFIEKASRLKRHQQNNSVDEHLMNNTYIPLWSTPPTWVRKVDIEKQNDLDAAARWLAQNYDHKCARELMKSISDPGRNSIYILSSLTRLSRNNKPTIVLIQEINDGISAPNFDLIDEYFRKTWYQRRWTEEEVKTIAEILSFSVNPTETVVEFEIPLSDFMSDPQEELQQMNSTLENSAEQADGNSLAVDSEQTRQELIGNEELKVNKNPEESDRKNTPVSGHENQLPQRNSKKKVISIIYPQ